MLKFYILFFIIDYYLIFFLNFRLKNVFEVKVWIEFVEKGEILLAEVVCIGYRSFIEINKRDDIL